MKIIKALEAGPTNVNTIDAREEISKIFVDGFYQWLRYFSKDKEKLVKAFKHIFNLERFYLAIIDGEIAAITACNDGSSKTISLDKKELKKNLGFIKGRIAYFVLKGEFENKPYPFTLESDMASIEFVATKKDFRGKGFASNLLKTIINDNPYKTYVLEVADTNTPAVKLYEKLGFREFTKVKENIPNKVG